MAGQFVSRIALFPQTPTSTHSALPRPGRRPYRGSRWIAVAVARHCMRSGGPQRPRWPRLVRRSHRPWRRRARGDLNRPIRVPRSRARPRCIGAWRPGIQHCDDRVEFGCVAQPSSTAVSATVGALNKPIKKSANHRVASAFPYTSGAHAKPSDRAKPASSIRPRRCCEYRVLPPSCATARSNSDAARRNSGKSGENTIVLRSSSDTAATRPAGARGASRPAPAPARADKTPPHWHTRRRKSCLEQGSRTPSPPRS